MLQMMGSFAQFERAMILKRQAEGIALAKAKGAYKGRKASIDRKMVSNIIKAGCGLAVIEGAAKSCPYGGH